MASDPFFAELALSHTEENTREGELPALSKGDKSPRVETLLQSS
jgi:hypothetical protein